MRTSTICGILLSLVLFAVAGCGGDSGEALAKEMEAAIQAQKDELKNVSDADKSKEIAARYKTKFEAINARAAKLSAGEKEVYSKKIMSNVKLP